MEYILVIITEYDRWDSWQRGDLALDQSQVIKWFLEAKVPLPSRLATHERSLALPGGKKRAIRFVMKTEA
jgi:hypothetical protein